MVSWWTNTTYALYNQRKQSIIEQYNNYTVPAGKVNGQLTIGENIADNGGLKAAYRVCAVRVKLGLDVETLAVHCHCRQYARVYGLIAKKHLQAK